MVQQRCREVVGVDINVVKHHCLNIVVIVVVVQDKAE